MLNILIHDSQEAAVKKMNDMLRSTIRRMEMDAGVVLATTSAAELLSKAVKSAYPFLYYVEVAETGRMQGMELVKRVREKDRDSYLVLTSAAPIPLERMLQPYVRASGFHKKPVAQEELCLTLKGVYLDFQSVVRREEGHYPVSVRSTEFKVPYSDILFFESRGKKMVLKTHFQEICFYATMDDVLANLPGHFIRSHKSYIVNLLQIEGIDHGAGYIHFGGGYQALLSRGYKQAVMDRFKKR